METAKLAIRMERARESSKSENAFVIFTPLINFIIRTNPSLFLIYK